MMQEYYGPTIQAQDYINKLFSLPATGKEQDWEFELADRGIVVNLLNEFIGGNNSLDVQCALALLLIESLEQANCYGEISIDVIRSFSEEIAKNEYVYGAMFFYWIHLKRADDENFIKMILNV